MNLPERIETEEQLDDLLSQPASRLTEMIGRLGGDIMILGIGGKMGLTLGPGTGKLVSEHVLGSTPSVETHALRADRF